MTMNDWGGQSVPSLLAPNELKNHQVIKEEVRHFVSPGSQRPRYGRNNSLPNVHSKRGESRWQSSVTSNRESKGTLARNADSPPAFRGAHSPSSVRKQLLSAGSSSSSEHKTKKKKVVPHHKKGERMVAGSAHERTTLDGTEIGKSSSPRHSKRIQDFQIKSAHESRTRNGLLEDDDDDGCDDDDGFGGNYLSGRNLGSQEMASFDRVRFSSLFETDSFTGTFPLGGGAAKSRQGGTHALGGLATRSLDTLPTHSSSPGAVGASSPLLQKKQPKKSAMRKPAQGSSNASSVSSHSAVAQDHAEESLSTLVMKNAMLDETHGALVPNMPAIPAAKIMDDRWESDLPTDSKSPPSPSPKVPGRAFSDGSVSLGSVLLPLAGDSDTALSNSATMQQSTALTEADVNGSTTELENSLANQSNEGDFDEPSLAAHEAIAEQDTVGVPLHPNVCSDLFDSGANPSTGCDPATSGVMKLKQKQDAGIAVPKQRRRSTGVLAQKWEEQFPSKTPILPQSAPTTPKDSARKRFNHRRRGSFGIYANVSPEDDEPRPPRVPSITKSNQEDEYDLFLQSGATGDFASWVEQYRKGKEISPSTSPSIHRKSLLPPTQRRGSTGALAQRWEQELLPALQATSTMTTSPPLTPTSIAVRRGSGSVREKLRVFGSLAQNPSEKSPGVNNGDTSVLDEVSNSRRESKRRGSMAALVEKWEKLTTPAGSPKDNITTAHGSLSSIVDRCNNIPFEADESERCNPSSAHHITSEAPLMHKSHSADDPPDLIPYELPLKAIIPKQKRRGSTGTITTKSRREVKEGPTAKSSLGKTRIRGVSIGHVNDKPTEKKKKTKAAPNTSNPSKTKIVAEPRKDDASQSSLPSLEQVAGEGSMERASKKSPKPSPKLVAKHRPGASDQSKIRKGPNTTTTKVKATKNDLDLSKNTTGSQSSKTSMSVGSDMDTSQRSTTGSSQSKRTRTIKVSTYSSSKMETTTTAATKTTTGGGSSSSSHSSTKVKKRSNSVGAIKVKSKKHNTATDSSRSRSATRGVAAADAPATKPKKHLPGKLREAVVPVA